MGVNRCCSDFGRKVAVGAMRRYIFTGVERAAVLDWLRTGRRNVVVNDVLWDVGKSSRVLLSDCELLVAVLKKRNEGY